MATTRKRRRKRKLRLMRVCGWLAFGVLLFSMLAAYVSNQVTIRAKKTELENLYEQIDQQQALNEEMERILSGDSDEVTEWIARDSFGYAAPNERVYYDISGN
jgi:cell division protein DivIC